MKVTKADTWFSRWIRLRDAWESNGVLVARCCTCKAIRDIRRIDCGHYRKRQHMSTRFHESNALPQCKPCNGWEQGDPERMAVVIDKKFGDGTAEYLRGLEKRVYKPDVGLIEMAYREKVADLLKQMGWERYRWW